MQRLSKPLRSGKYQDGRQSHRPLGRQVQQVEGIRRHRSLKTSPGTFRLPGNLPWGRFVWQVVTRHGDVSFPGNTPVKITAKARPAMGTFRLAGNTLVKITAVSQKNQDLLFYKAWSFTPHGFTGNLASCQVPKAYRSRCPCSACYKLENNNDLA